MSHDRGCPCGRERDEYDTCPNKDCYKRTRTMTMKTEKYYIWSKQGQALELLDDLEWLCRNPEFDSKTDKIYELGPEVKIEMVVKVIPAKPITRGHEGANNYGSY